MNDPSKTLGSICAGIGGFDLGFERAGWTTSWTIERDDVNRAVLTDRFARARHFKDLGDWRSFGLSPVACITFGFPCQDISVMGQHRRDKSQNGLGGRRSGLFFQIMEIVGELQPSWLVIENVPGLLHSNACRDIQVVIAELAQRNYLGFARVLNSQYFGVPQNRRRLFLVAGSWTLPQHGLPGSLRVSGSATCFVWIGTTRNAGGCLGWLYSYVSRQISAVQFPHKYGQ